MKNKKTSRVISLILSVVMIFSLAGCGGSSNKNSEHSFVKVTMQSGDSFVIELYPEYAPETVENFLSLVESGFYDGLTFHRVIRDFMAQGGDPDGDGTGGSSKTVKGEFSLNGFTKNELKHARGVVSMARSSDYDSASSQFFICYADNQSVSNLDGSYAAFGKVIEGMEVVDSFLDIDMLYVAGSGEFSKPSEPIVMEKVEVVDANTVK